MRLHILSGLLLIGECTGKNSVVWQIPWYQTVEYEFSGSLEVSHSADLQQRMYNIMAAF